eukprot:TRINITY_DN38997_c0_g1_i1.p1 TRINITY_DN38997_c0_g1~~TRINITY_DN38997_c0_g1_i1.p1  ORF type:complete len:891 (+),score=189.69 TRINITY_DN38997_c0_g1_i1:75-2747(+)
MIREPYIRPSIKDVRDLVRRAPRPEDDLERVVSLRTNLFKVTMQAGTQLHQYNYTVSPACRSLDEEKKCLEGLWDMIQEKLAGPGKPFVIQVPGRIFTPTMPKSEIVLNSPGNSELNIPVRRVCIKYCQAVQADHVNNARCEAAEALCQYLMRRVTYPALPYYRVGRRYFSSTDANSGRKPISVFNGICVDLTWLIGSGPHLQVDIDHRVMERTGVSPSGELTMSPKSVLGQLQESLDADSLYAFNRPGSPVAAESQSEWNRHCARAIVVTSYNMRMYKIKAVRFDMNPLSTFMQRVREEFPPHNFLKKQFAQWYRETYRVEHIVEEQPMLEAYPEKQGEEVYLLPQLCAFTTLDMSTGKEVVSKQATVSPSERYSGIVQHTMQFTQGSVVGMGKKERSAFQAEWNLNLELEPEVVMAKTLPPPLVKLNGLDPSPISDGTFMRELRFESKAGITIDHWIWIQPDYIDEDAKNRASTWLNAFYGDIAKAMGVTFAEPTRLDCPADPESLRDMLLEHIKPSVKLVFLVLPDHRSRRFYETFKKVTCLERPVVSQALTQSFTRKRTRMAKTMFSVFHHTMAKASKPFWSVDLADADNPGEGPCAPYFAEPTMVIGLHVHTNADRMSCVSLVASISSMATQWYSTCKPLERDDVQGSMSIAIQLMLRDALQEFSRRHEDILPQHLVVYRETSHPEDWSTHREIEIEAVIHCCSRITSKQGQYKPEIVFMAISKSVMTRFFMECTPEEAEAEGMPFKYPSAGTVIDDPKATYRDVFNFYLFSQPDVGGDKESKDKDKEKEKKSKDAKKEKEGKDKTTWLGAVPAHYSVLYSSDPSSLDMTALQKLTYRLCYLYFIEPRGVRLVAPVMYAKKLARLIGESVGQEPHPKLRTLLFYL